MHTVASPCAEMEMLPPLIVERAMDIGLGLIAITDHNTVCNAGAVMRAARGLPLTVWPGMEVQTREEVHLLCLFEDLDHALDWQSQVYAALPPLPNQPEVFGAQLVVDHRGDWIRLIDRLLLVSTSLTAEEVVCGVAALGGLTIAAHVDRPAYSLLASLGFVPEGLALAGLEVADPQGWWATPDRSGQQAGWALTCSSDAHRLEEMRGRMVFEVVEATLAEFRLALQCAGGRRVILTEGPGTA
ncbi:MAG TPA: PHP domain-containing protein [Anaerolineae bacterium]|nr:PHP domain-containing protein [Anaerolineae bacterium]